MFSLKARAMGPATVRLVAVLLVLCGAGVAQAQEAPPPMEMEGAAPSDGASDAAPQPWEVDLPQGSGEMPPPLDGSEPPSWEASPMQQVPIGPPPDRPFVERLNTLELGLAAGALFGGWAAAMAVAVGAIAAFTTVAVGRPAWDAPLMLWQTVRHPTDTHTPGGRLFGGPNGAVMMGALAMSTLGGAVAAAAVATGLGQFSQDWSTQMGPVAATGLLASALCLAAGGAALLLSLLVPVPPLWLAVFAAAVAAGVVLPPVAVVVGQIITKQARPTPGGIIRQMVDVMMANPLIRQKLGGL